MPLPKFGMRPVPREAYVLPEVHSYHLCLAKQLPYEPLGFCCAKGDVSLYPVTFSDELRELFTGSTPESAHFRHYIRPFNDAFAFTSVGRSFWSWRRRLTFNGMQDFRMELFLVQRKFLIIQKKYTPSCHSGCMLLLRLHKFSAYCFFFFNVTSFSYAFDNCHSWE